MSPTYYGTGHFVSRKAADAYYAKQGLSADDVSRKLSEKEIFIGAPPYTPGDDVRLDEGRFVIRAAG